MDDLSDAIPEVQLGALSDADQDMFLAAFARQQAATAELMRLAAKAIDDAPMSEKEFAGDDLALLMNVHPRTGQAFAVRSSLACGFPELMQEMEAGHLTDRHVHAAVDELHRCLGERADRLHVLEQVLERCREKVTRGGEWPRPGELARMIRRAALLLDLEAAQRRKEEMVLDRQVISFLMPDGGGGLSVTGPAEQVGLMVDAIRARADADRTAGDTRSLAQREYDATFALLTGLDPATPGRAYEAQVLVPFTTAAGGDLELAELPGHGPVLPSTARALLEQAPRLRRVCVDAATGEVLAVDDATPNTPEALARMATDPVQLRDLSTHAYRPTVALVRHVGVRDLVCRFPGCTTTAPWTDLDHRTPWPAGPTDEPNLHCLCRHHHRAKQSGLFTVTAEPDGTTVWTTRDGRRYRRPPPTW